ncbi:MAG TPA: amidohydrolase family protein [Allosphingosinicella sp.]|nr:amidohydrolase family protein [Allosphingosinicella sp.]
MATIQKKSTAIKASEDDARKYWLDEGRTAGGVIREIDHSQYFEGVHPLFKGIKIVDCDTHFTEPPDLFQRNAPARLKDRMPRVVEKNGAVRWYVGDKDFGSYGGNVVSKERNKLLGKLSFTNYDLIHPGSFQVKPRLEEMDRMGVWGHICFQNGGVTQAGALMALNDPELVDTIMRVYNDACIERMAESGGRINTMAQLPYWDNKKLIPEARRMIDMGIKGFVMPDRPERAGDAFLAEDGSINPVWEEFFDLCNATGTPMNFHINAALDSASAIWDNFNFYQTQTVVTMLHTLAISATIANFMVSGILDKYENLKLGMIESGIGWVPFVLELLDHQFNEMLVGESVGLKKRPKEYFAKNFWVSYWFEKYAPQNMLEEIGLDRVMFETDFPHPTSIYPGVQERMVESIGHLDYEKRKMILSTNAATLFNLDL